MIKFKKFAKSLNQNIDYDNNKIQESLLFFYLKTNKNFINSYFIDDNNHYIEFYNIKRNSFFTIYFSKKNIHIIIEDSEIIYFFDDINFKNKYKIIFKSLFYGLYIIKSTYKKDKLIKQELDFNDLSLSQFPIRSEFNNFFFFFSSNKNITCIEKKGTNWIQEQ